MPLPSTTQFNMSYPTTVDFGGTAPIIGDTGEWADNGTTTWPVANQVLLVPVYFPFGFPNASQMRTDFNLGGNGHYDLGVYDSSGANNDPGNLLAHCAATSTSLATATGLVTASLITSVSLAPGIYWLAMVVDNITDKFTRHVATASAIGPVRQFAGAVPLGSVGALSNLGSSKPLLTLLRSNSWS